MLKPHETCLICRYKLKLKKKKKKNCSQRKVHYEKNGFEVSNPVLLQIKNRNKAHFVENFYNIYINFRLDFN